MARFRWSLLSAKSAELLGARRRRLLEGGHHACEHPDRPHGWNRGVHMHAEMPRPYFTCAPVETGRSGVSNDSRPSASEAANSIP